MGGRCFRRERLARQKDGASVDFGAGCQQNSPVHRVLKLPHIATPQMGLQFGERIRADRPVRQTIGFGVFLGEELGQHFDVAGALAQGRVAEG